ncbi:hypothetical protein C0995_003643 [Termitomyces sp. Mi166|nr:hypothetical protein C0995_003643 [Termitomyces sp. Mi166\
MPSIGVDETQRTETSSQSWGDFSNRWFGWPQVASDVQTGVEEARPSQTRPGTATAEPNQQAGVQISTLVKSVEVLQLVTVEWCRTKEELNETKDALRRLRKEKAELEQENERRNNWRDRLWELLQDPKTKELERQNSNLIKDLRELESELKHSRMTNNIESQIASILVELQQLEWRASDVAVRMTETDRRDLYRIRRRIISEKATKVLRRQYQRGWPPIGRHESFYDWSGRVRYPDWERIARIARKAKREGNQIAHKATPTRMQATIDFAWTDVDEEGYPEEAEVLQEMLDIINDGGQIDEDDDDVSESI